MEQVRTLMLPVAGKPGGKSVAMRKHRRRLARWAFRFLEAALALVFLAAVVHHVITLNFRPLAALFIPLLLVFFGFTSLLYTRGRSLTKGKGQMRSLFAAEHAMQATLWHLLGIVVGMGLYGVLARFGATANPGETYAGALWLLLFLLPYGLMQIGLLCFMRAVWLIAPHFLHRPRASELRRRLQQ